MLRLNVFFRDDERTALLKLSEQERRKPQAQVAIIVRRELERLGLLEPPEAAQQEVRQCDPVQL